MYNVLKVMMDLWNSIEFYRILFLEVSVRGGYLLLTRCLLRDIANWGEIT